MTEEELTVEGEFQVKQSKSINYIVGGVLIMIFFVSMLFGDSDWSNYILAMGMFLIPGAFALVKARQNATIMRINKKGFYYAGKLVTDWKLFYDAQVQEKMVVGDYRDNFILDIRYYSEDFSLIYTKRIPLTNTQDKGDEEILDAVRFYNDASRNDAMEDKN